MIATRTSAGGVRKSLAPASRIAGWYKTGLPAEEIAAQYGHLSLAQVHAALTYYANAAEIEADLADEEAFAERVERESVVRAAAANWIRRYFDEDAIGW